MNNKNIEYSTKQMIAYFLLTNNEIKDYKDKTLSNYIKVLEEKINNIDLIYVLNKVNVKQFSDFLIRHIVNTEELFCYATVIFNRLLNYYNREFNDNDIIKETELIMSMFSARTILTEAKKIQYTLLNR